MFSSDFSVLQLKFISFSLINWNLHFLSQESPLANDAFTMLPCLGIEGKCS